MKSPNHPIQRSEVLSAKETFLPAYLYHVRVNRAFQPFARAAASALSTGWSEALNIAMALFAARDWDRYDGANGENGGFLCTQGVTIGHRSGKEKTTNRSQVSMYMSCWMLDAILLRLLRAYLDRVCDWAARSGAVERTVMYASLHINLDHVHM